MLRQFEMTQSGRQTLEEELRQLYHRRGEVAELLASAKSLGDLSENAEYHEAKYQQGIIEGRVAEVETILANAIIVAPTNHTHDAVGLFSTVRVLDLDDDDEIEYTLVPVFEADYSRGRISVESPLGQGLLGKREGDEADIETPGGVTRLRVLSIRAGE